MDRDGRTTHFSRLFTATLPAVTINILGAADRVILRIRPVGSPCRVGRMRQIVAGAFGLYVSPTAPVCPIWAIYRRRLRAADNSAAKRMVLRQRSECRDSRVPLLDFLALGHAV